MIISVSRRTDIPAYYADWFYSRLQAGYACYRNPMNTRQVTVVSLSPVVADCFVFWTKNFAPMLDRLDLLKGHAYYIQFTLNAYGPEIEPYLPALADRLQAFQKTADKIGASRMVWRYDPIFLSRAYTVEYHIDAFSSIAARLKNSTERVVISFLDSYRKIQKNLEKHGMRTPSAEEKALLAREIAAAAKAYGLPVSTCAEEIDLSRYAISHASCIDKGLVEKIAGCRLSVKQAAGQRAFCGCMESVDIGAYHCCPHGCLYCYANGQRNTVLKNIMLHDPASPLLLGHIRQEDKMLEKKMGSHKDLQQSLF